jgi:hypothetical protein
LTKLLSKAGLAALVPVRRHSEAAQGDPCQWRAREAQPFHQLVSGSIRQSDVANEQLSLARLSEPEDRCSILRRKTLCPWCSNSRASTIALPHQSVALLEGVVHERQQESVVKSFPTGI